MPIDKKTIENLAHLAKLEFNDEEKEEIMHDLDRMIEFINQLQSVDTEGIEPLIYMMEEEADLRKDKVIQNTTQEEALKNAPDKDTDYIKVPKVLKR